MSKNHLKITCTASLLVAITFIIYFNALDNGFLMWDTRFYVVENPHIKAFTKENLSWMLTSFYLGNWHPLTWLSHALDYAIFGLEPWGHHLTSILIHCANVVLVFIVFIALLNIHQQKALAQLANQTLLAAGLATLLFSVHPHRVESVVWIAERKDVLCLFFVLLTLLFYLHYAYTSSTKRYYWFAIVSFTLALLSKPMAVTVPVLLLLFDIYPLRRTTLTVQTPVTLPVSYKALLLEKLPFFLLSIACSITIILAQHEDEAIADTQIINLSMRLLNAFNNILFYLSKLLFPFNLSPYYSFPDFNDFSVYLFSIVAIVISLLITGLASYFWYKQRYYWLAGWLFYLITLLPVSGLIQVGTQGAADRYTYLPMLPFYLLMGSSGLYICQLKSKSLQILAAASVLVLTLTFVTVTRQQIMIWKHDLIFWQYISLQIPNNPLAQLNLADAYAFSGHYEQAISHYQMVSQLEPYYTYHYGHWIIAYLQLNQWEEAIKRYEYAMNKQLHMGEYMGLVHFKMAELYLKQGRIPDAQQAIEKVLKIEPDYKPAKDLLKRITGQDK